MPYRIFQRAKTHSIFFHSGSLKTVRLAILSVKIAVPGFIRWFPVPLTSSHMEKNRCQIHLFFLLPSVERDPMLLPVREVIGSLNAPSLPPEGRPSLLPVHQSLAFRGVIAAVRLVIDGGPLSLYSALPPSHPLFFRASFSSLFNRLDAAARTRSEALSNSLTD